MVEVEGYGTCWQEEWLVRVCKAYNHIINPAIPLSSVKTTPPPSKDNAR